MKIGQEALVKITDKISDNKYVVINTNSGLLGRLIVKGRLKVSDDGIVNAWVIQYDKKDCSYIYGNSYFGKYSISNGIGERYKDIIQRLFSSPDSITDNDVSCMKGMVNRCIKKDQWDWFTTYEYIGYPESIVMRHFVSESVIARDSVRECNYDKLIAFRDKYCFIFNNMMFHLGEKLDVLVDDVNEPIAALNSAVWKKLSFDSRKNIKMLENIGVRTSQFILMHYFVTLENEFLRHLIIPFIENNTNLNSSRCRNPQYTLTHDILIGKTHASLGAVPYIGRFAGNIEACNNSEPIAAFTEYLGANIVSFKEICELVSNTQICGMPLVLIRNGLAHGNSSIIEKIDDNAFVQMRSFLLHSPSSIIERIINISLLEES